MRRTDGASETPLNSQHFHGRCDADRRGSKIPYGSGGVRVRIVEFYYTGMFIIDRKIIYDYGYRLQSIESGVIINDPVRNRLQTDYCCSGLRSTIP